MLNHQAVRPFAGNIIDGDAREIARRGIRRFAGTVWPECADRADGPEQREFAMRIALAFHGKPIPTVRQLVALFPMHRSTAYRWLRALRAARGEP